MRIIANSYGCSTASVTSCFSAQFEKAIRAFRDQGGLFVVSAGNDGTDNDKVPASGSLRPQCICLQASADEIPAADAADCQHCGFRSPTQCGKRLRNNVMRSSDWSSDMLGTERAPDLGADDAGLPREGGDRMWL